MLPDSKSLVWLKQKKSPRYHNLPLIRESRSDEGIIMTTMNPTTVNKNATQRTKKRSQGIQLTKIFQEKQNIISLESSTHEDFEYHNR